MKFTFSALALLASMACSSPAQGLILVKPMPPAEIVVELKSGLSSADVAQDVQQHRLTRVATAEELKAMQQAGAAADLLALAQSRALVSGAAPAGTPVPPASSPPLPAAGYWIFGLLTQKTPDGGAVVACKNVQPTKPASALPRAADEYVYFPTAPPGRTTSDGHTLISCEAAFVGKRPMRMLDGSVAQVPVVQLVNDLTPAPGASSAAAGPSPTPSPRRVVILQGGWVSLRAYGGPEIELKLLGIDFDSIRVRLSTWPATRVVPVERGRDARTVIYDDGKGGEVAYIDAIDRPDNGGVFEFSVPAVGNAMPSAATAP